MTIGERTAEFARPKIKATHNHTSKHAGIYAVAALITALSTALPALVHVTLGQRAHEREVEAIVEYLTCAIEETWNETPPDIAQRVCARLLDGAPRLARDMSQAAAPLIEGGSP